MSESIGQRFVLGGLSCMVAAVVSNPVDVLKTRFQIHGELQTIGSNGVGSSYGIVNGTIRIIKNEGLVAMYKGLTPSLLREATYSTLRMGGYDVIKGYFVDKSTGKTTLISKITSGAISGAVGAFITSPTDLVKVRMQASSNGVKYKSILSAFKEIIKNEGYIGLYKGVVPTTQRAALLTASQIPSYDQFKHFLLDNGVFEGEGLQVHCVSSIFAGFVASVTTSPLDLVKTRIMNQSFDPTTGKGILYKSTFDCFKKTYVAEGITGLYKGFLPNFFRISPHTIVTFIVYEQLRKLGGISAI